MNAPHFTHDGWMLFCPIKLADIDSIDTGPVIAARWRILEPLLSVAEFVQGLVLSSCSLVNPEYEPMFYFRITGERRK